MRVLDCTDPQEREWAVSSAVASIQAGELVVLPTESAYVIATDAFSPSATDAIRRVRGIGPETPLQVLVKDAGVLAGVASGASAAARNLAEAFWPGPLTLVVPSSPSIRWRLGGDERYVQLRSPLHPVALEVVTEAGPVATSIARREGGPLVTGRHEAADLEDDVTLFLEHAGLEPAPRSTILDCTGDPGEVRILRLGAVTAQDLAEILGYEPSALQ